MKCKITPRSALIFVRNHQQGWSVLKIFPMFFWLAVVSWQISTSTISQKNRNILWTDKPYWPPHIHPFRMRSSKNMRNSHRADPHHPYNSLLCHLKFEHEANSLLEVFGFEWNIAPFNWYKMSQASESTCVSLRKWFWRGFIKHTVYKLHIIKVCIIGIVG